MVSAPIDLASIASGSYAAFAGVKLIGKTFGKMAAKKLSGFLAKIVAGAVSMFINVSVGTLGNMIFLRLLGDYFFGEYDWLCA